jgi:integrase
MKPIPNLHTSYDRYGKPKWTYRRQIPMDLRKRLGKTTIIVLLGNSMSEAISDAYKLNDQYNALFKTLRNPKNTDFDSVASLFLSHGIPLQRHNPDDLETSMPVALEEKLDRLIGDDPNQMPSGVKEVLNILTGNPEIRLSDATTFYLTKRDLPTQESLNAQNVSANLISIIGDLRIQDFRRAHVNEWVNKRQSEVKNSTIKQNIAVIARILNHSIKEKDLTPFTVPFTNYKLDTKDSEVRHEYSHSDWNKLYNACINYRQNKRATQTDETRIMILLMMTIGCRISEASGVLVQDLHLDKGEECIDIHPNPIRRLKTKNSYRTVPLVDPVVIDLLKGSYEERKEFGGDAKLFVKSKAPTKASEHWIKRQIGIKQSDGTYELPEGIVANHSFRHSVSNALKNARTPPTIHDNLLGWSNGAMRERYGSRADCESGRPYLTKAINLLKLQAIHKLD